MKYFRFFWWVFNRFESSAEAPLSETSGTVGKDHCLEVCALGRTFYLSASTDAEAMQWKEAIDDCVRALPSSFGTFFSPTLALDYQIHVIFFRMLA